MPEQTLKVLSVRQPWASLLLSGEKWCENRTWTTNYRGPLWIHASSKVETDACDEYEIDSRQLIMGAVIGVVELIEVLDAEANAKTFVRDITQLAEKHALDLTHGPDFIEGPFCWIAKSPRKLVKPIQMKGKLNLWTLNPPPGHSLVTLAAPPLIGSMRSDSNQLFGIEVNGKTEHVAFSVEPDGIHMEFRERERSRIAKPADSWNYRDGEAYYRAGCERAWELFPEHFRSLVTRRGRVRQE